MPRQRISAARTRIARGLLSAALLAAGSPVGVSGSVHPGPPLTGRAAPQFTRDDLEHHRIRLADYRGKVVLLNFWATWCAPCRTETPRFVEWQRRYGAEGLQILGVSIDDDAPPVASFAAELHVNYPVMMGDAPLGRLYRGVFGVPVTFLIDRRGVVRGRLDGEQDLDRLEGKIRELLRARPAGAEKR